jgi:hypothetical protein
LALCCVLFLDETGWTRPRSDTWPEPHSSFIQRKLSTYLFIGRCTPQVSSRQILRLGLMPLIIGICPAPLIVGFFILVIFAWAVAITTLTSVYLQTPKVLGGYGFTPNQNAFCKHHIWPGHFERPQMGKKYSLTTYSHFRGLDCSWRSFALRSSHQ